MHVYVCECVLDCPQGHAQQQQVVLSVEALQQAVKIAVVSVHVCACVLVPRSLD